MTSDAFEKIWEEASTRHPTGLVITTLFNSLYSSSYPAQG